MRFAYRRAFTLIELLVVISIIGVLVAWLLPVIGNEIDQTVWRAIGSRDGVEIAAN